MSNILKIFRREVGAYVSSPSSYVFLIIFLILSSSLFFFVNLFFKAKVATMDGFFFYLPWVFLFFVPAVAMRVWAEEKKSGTYELLMTLPVRDIEAVLGKYLAAFALLLTALALTFPIPVVVNFFAEVDETTKRSMVDWAPMICGYIGAALIGGVILAIGTWASSLTQNQIIAFILSSAIAFALILLFFLSQYVPQGEWVVRFSPYYYFSEMYRGRIRLGDIAFFVSAIAFFLFLNIRSVESRKWN